MKTMLLACAAAAALLAADAAAAQTMQRLSQFLMSCTQNSSGCRSTIRDYITAADQQKLICRPADQSVNEAASETLHYMREVASKDDTLYAGPYDDAMWLAISTKWPCQTDQQSDPPPPSNPAGQ